MYKEGPAVVFSIVLVVLTVALLIITAPMPFDSSGSIRAALISSCGTALVAVLAFWQIGRQAQYAIKQNQHNEAQKLKVELYKDIVPVCDAAFRKEAELKNYIYLFEQHCRNYKIQRAAGYRAQVPEARVKNLIELRSDVVNAAIEFIKIVERWQIMDPRLDVFKWAMNSAIEDVDNAFNPYFEASVRVFPIPTESGAGGATLPWDPPTDGDMEIFQGLGKKLTDALNVLGTFVFDFQVEAQNLLLGDLFGYGVPRRSPIDPTATVIRLDQYESLMKHINENTAWGKKKSRLEENVRKALGESRIL